MTHRDLNLSFTIENTFFTILSICVAQIVQPIPKHSHSKNSYELHYVPFGYGSLFAADQCYEITPGALYMTGPNTEHEQISISNNPMTEYCIYLKVDNPEPTSTNSIISSFLNQHFWFGKDDGSILELLKQITFEIDTHAFGYELLLQSLLQQVILKMIRKYQNSNHLIPVKCTFAKHTDTTYLTIELAFLYQYRDLTLDKLSNQINLGIRQTERLLKKLYQKTFLQKKMEARMHAAATLLIESDESLAAIAVKTGYSSTEHFSYAFKHHFQNTPGRYRKENQRLH